MSTREEPNKTLSFIFSFVLSKSDCGAFSANCTSDVSNLSPKVAYPPRAADTSGPLSPLPNIRSSIACFVLSKASLTLVAPITSPLYVMFCAACADVEFL
ncbi:hypothetical protein D3C71_1701060 [compost metagenome]